MEILGKVDFPPLAGPACEKGRFRLAFHAMGTECEILYGASSLKKANEFREASLSWVRRFEDRYSRYKPESLLSRINDSAGKEFVPIEEEDARLLDLCDSLHFQSKGVFDPSSLPLSLIWDFKSKNPAVPPQEAILQALHKVGWKKVVRDAGGVFLPEVGMGLDFGGFGKEYAVDRVVELAESMDVESILVNFGGDVRVMGSSPDGEPWRVGVENPKQPGKPQFVLRLKDQAVATSGNYRRFFEHAGKVYGHVLDHRTGFPCSGDCLSSTVVSRSCLEAGVLATCSLLEFKEDGLRMLEGFFGAEGCVSTTSGLNWSKKFSEFVLANE